MTLCDPPTSPAGPAFDARCGAVYPASKVFDELQWRTPGRNSPIAQSPRVIATRWRAALAGTQESTAATPDGCHIVKIVLRNMNIRLSTVGRTLHDGVVTPGAFHVTEPATSVRCLFRGPYDVLHLHVPGAVIDECVRDACVDGAAVFRSESKLARDPALERLGRALLDADQTADRSGDLYADCISMAIIARLLARSTRKAPDERPKAAELARWRLKRAMDYVEAHLAEPVSLADVAAAAGLTRMHFAAQFRAATGLRPHEYLLRRRIERAQALLVGTGAAVVDVALSVGFQTQAHFTSVFNKFAGQPPRAWRLSQGWIDNGLKANVSGGVVRHSFLGASKANIATAA
jgi:AraC family transcriptional regulator